MEFRKIENLCSKEMIELWNKEFLNEYPLTEELINRNVIKCNNLDSDSSLLVYHNESLIGFVIGKIWKEDFYVKGYDDLGWLSLIYVKPDFRNQGIGTHLINHLIHNMKAKNKKTIMVGKDPNNFFPGIPREMKQYDHWFQNRKFELIRNTHDLMKEVNENSKIIDLPNIPYQVTYMDQSTMKATLQFMEKNFPGRWTFELEDYIKRGGTGREYLILIDQNKVIGFCRINDGDTRIINYNMTWKALFQKPSGIGPLGIDEFYRNQKLGFYIVAYATNELTSRNVSNIVIDWTSLINFYQKFGFSVWKTYCYSQFSLNHPK